MPPTTAKLNDTSVIKLNSRSSPRGEQGQKLLSSGLGISMRLWENEPPNGEKPPSIREYETVGFVIRGKAELQIGNQVVLLEEGDSWSVPKGARHTYKILEPFTAIEATHPAA